MNLIVDCIHNSFLNSKKRHLLITGSKQVGKTTLFHEMVLKLTGQKCVPGITTKLICEESVYLYENNTDNKTKIGLYNPHANNFGRPMISLPEGFASLGVPALKRAINSSSEWLSIDEIGYLESQQEGFKNIIIEAFNNKRIIAVVRLKDTPFINQLKQRDDVYLINLDDMSLRFGCIIMASGKSKRYGSNKLFETYNRKTFFENALDITENIFFKRIVVTRDLEVKRICEQKGIDVFYHEYPYRNQAIAIGMNEILNTDYCMFVNCDQPALTQNSIKKMVESAIFSKDKILRLSYDNQVGSPVLFASCFYKELEQLPEKQGGSFVIRQYPDRVKCVEACNKEELIDIDVKEDLKKLIDFWE